MQEHDNLLIQQPAATAGFDYNSFQPSVVTFLRGQALRIQQYCTKSVIQIGKDLAAAKRYLSHGEFTRWVVDEVGISARTAQAYMRAASWASSKSATVALLPPTALYALSSPGVPKEFVDRVLSELEAGERIPLQLLRAQIRALRESAADQPENAAHEEFEGRSGDVLGADDPTAAMISSAVRILARALTAADFALVRDLITSKPVIDDPNLARILESVFTSFECAAREPHRSKRIRN